MKMQKSNIAYNLTTLRQLNKFSQEEVAERIGVSRQAVAKWEAGQKFTITVFRLSPVRKSETNVRFPVIQNFVNRFF